MSLEAEFVTWITEPSITAIFYGGIYSYEAIRRTAIARTNPLTEAAFDADTGKLLPCLLVKESEAEPFGGVNDVTAGIQSMRQIVRVTAYEDQEFTNINIGLPLITARVHGHKFTRSWPAERIGLVPRQREPGVLKNASMARLDFAVVFLQTPT